LRVDCHRDVDVELGREILLENVQLFLYLLEQFVSLHELSDNALSTSTFEVATTDQTGAAFVCLGFLLFFGPETSSLEEQTVLLNALSCCDRPAGISGGGEAPVQVNSLSDFLHRERLIELGLCHSRVLLHVGLYIFQIRFQPRHVYLSLSLSSQFLCPFGGILVVSLAKRLRDGAVIGKRLIFSA
jgi:hypothetical protein